MAHKTKSGKSSQAWKAFEREVASKFQDVGFTQAHRVSRGDDLGESDTDVKVPEVPQLQIDTKYRSGGMSIISLFKETESKYVRKKSNDFLVLPLKAGGMTGSVSVIRTEILAELIAHRYLGGSEKQGLTCPQCQSVLQVGQFLMGLAPCTCPTCEKEILVRETDIPKGTVIAFPQPESGPQAA